MASGGADVEADCEVEPQDEGFETSTNSEHFPTINTEDYKSYVCYMHEDNLNQDNFDILVVNAEEDNNDAFNFKKHIEKDITFMINKQHLKPRVKLLCEIFQHDGFIDPLDFAFPKTIFIFLFVTKQFCEHQETLLKGHALLLETIREHTNKWCVIPVHTKSKTDMDYKLPMCLNSLRPIQYWSKDQFYTDAVRSMLEGRIGLRLERDGALECKRKKFFEENRLKLMSMMKAQVGNNNDDNTVLLKPSVFFNNESSSVNLPNSDINNQFTDSALTGVKLKPTATNVNTDVGDSSFTKLKQKQIPENAYASDVEIDCPEQTCQSLEISPRSAQFMQDVDPQADSFDLIQVPTSQNVQTTQDMQQISSHFSDISLQQQSIQQRGDLPSSSGVLHSVSTSMPAPIVQVVHHHHHYHKKEIKIGSVQNLAMGENAQVNVHGQPATESILNDSDEDGRRDDDSDDNSGDDSDATNPKEVDDNQSSNLSTQGLMQQSMRSNPSVDGSATGSEPQSGFPEVAQ